MAQGRAPGPFPMPDARCPMLLPYLGLVCRSEQLQLANLAGSTSVWAQA